MLKKRILKGEGNTKEIKILRKSVLPYVVLRTIIANVIFYIKTHAKVENIYTDIDLKSKLCEFS